MDGFYSAIDVKQWPKTVNIINFRRCQHDWCDKLQVLSERGCRVVGIIRVCWRVLCWGSLHAWTEQG